MLRNLCVILKQSCAQALFIDPLCNIKDGDVLSHNINVYELGTFYVDNSHVIKKWAKLKSRITSGNLNWALGAYSLLA